MTDMTDTASTNKSSTEIIRSKIAARHRSEKRFKMLGLGAVLTAIAFLIILMSTIVGKGLPAFTYNYVSLPLDLSAVNKSAPEKGSYSSSFKKSATTLLPHMSGRKDKRIARGIFANGADFLIQREVVANPVLAGQVSTLKVPVSDFADLYLKGLVAENQTTNPNSEINVALDKKKLTITSDNPIFQSFIEKVNLVLTQKLDLLERQIAAQERSLAVFDADDERVAPVKAKIEQYQAEQTKLLERQKNSTSSNRLDSSMPSLLIEFGGGMAKVEEVSPNQATAIFLVPTEKAGKISVNDWSLRTVETPEANRKFSDKEIGAIEHIRSQNLITKGINKIFFTGGASREPELAGIWGAVVGSFLTLIVTLLLAFPVGVAAAVYLEEFAPKNRITDIIEVNINNLAAVPSIVFGLLGLAVFLNWFNFPRSAPLVGGMVLALMTLPTIIIASRAALKAVPPSIREAALGIGASRIQTVFHHVLPLAMPGILTGTIIGMAQALGETAPLLMIGMVAFIVEVPGGFTDPSTVLPVQIFMWADFPEPAFAQKTAAAIMVLLVFLILMNALAVLLRKRFERRW